MINSTQVHRLARLVDRFDRGIKCQPGDSRSRGLELVRAAHDVVGGLTAARVALQNAYIYEGEKRKLAKEAEAQIIAAERAVLRWRDAVASSAGVQPWEAEDER